MLVTFSTPVYANITMFGDVAIQLLKLMGHSGAVPGALLAADVTAGAAASAGRGQVQRRHRLVRKSLQSDEDGEAAVSLSHRALPLIELLDAAAKANRDVMWDKNS